MFGFSLFCYQCSGFTLLCDIYKQMKVLSDWKWNKQRTGLTNVKRETQVESPASGEWEGGGRGKICAGRAYISSLCASAPPGTMSWVRPAGHDVGSSVLMCARTTGLTAWCQSLGLWTKLLLCAGHSHPKLWVVKEQAWAHGRKTDVKTRCFTTSVGFWASTGWAVHRVFFFFGATNTLFGPF